jgi:hypothetical protein
MVIVNLNNTKNIYLDSNGAVVEVDSGGFTLLQENIYSIALYPRLYLDLVDITIYDEFDDNEQVVEAYTSLADRGRQNIYIDYVFQNDKTYLIDLKDPEDDSLIWRGRLLSTDETNLQEFKTYDEDESNGIIEV